MLSRFVRNFHSEVKTGGDEKSKPPMSTIKVLEVKIKLTDPSIASVEELKIALADIKQHLNIPMYILSGYLDMYNMGPSKILRDIGTDNLPSNIIESFLLRTLLTNPSVYPIVSSRGIKALRLESAEGIHTRPISVVGALDLAGNFISIASEEPIIVVGISIRKKDMGNILKRPYDVVTTLRSSIYAGAVSLATYSFLKNKIPEFVNKFSAITKKGFIVYPVAKTNNEENKNILMALIRQMKFAINMYQSGTFLIYSAIKLARISEKNIPSRINLHKSELNVLSENSDMIISTTRTWRDNDMDIMLKYMISKLKKEIATDGNYWKYDMTPLNDLFIMNAMVVYLHVITEGKESEKFEAFLERLDYQNTEQANIKRADAQNNLREVKAKLYLTIIEDKFGVGRSNEILAKLRSKTLGSHIHSSGLGISLSKLTRVRDPNILISLLSKAEQNVVLSEYQSRMELWKASANNKCPHLGIYRNMKMANSDTKTKFYYNLLQDYIDKKSATGTWIDCTNCKFHIICPHYLDRIDMGLHNRPFDEIRDKLMKYATKIVNTSSGENVYSIYCSICSELMFEDYDISSQEELTGKMERIEDPLRSKIWGMSIQIVKYVKFTIPMDERKFANRVSMIVYPMVIVADESISKRRRKTLEVDDIDPRTQIYAVLFIFAYILNIVLSAKQGSEVILIGSKPGMKVSYYADFILNIISEKYQSLIYQVGDITSEFLKSRFAEAYKIVKNYGSNTLKQASPEEEFINYVLSVDAVYRYSLVVARATGGLANVRKRTAAGIRVEFETIFGMGIPALIRRAKESRNDPVIARMFTKSNVITIPPETRMEYLMRNPKINIYSTLYEPEYIDTEEFYSIGENVKYPINDTFQNVSFFEAYRLFNYYVKNVNSADNYDKYIKELSKYNKVIQATYKITQYNNLGPYYNNTPNIYNGKGTSSIVKLYDEAGRKHHWGSKSIFVYSNDTSIVEIPGNIAVSKQRTNGTLLPDMKLIDIICPVCNIKESKLSELDAEVVSTSLIAVSEMNVFYLFYESRCPKGELHNWVGNVCSKCKLSETTISSQEDKRMYYDEYKSQFETDYILRKK